MKKWTVILVTLLLLISALALVSCGGGEQGKSAYVTVNFVDDRGNILQISEIESGTVPAYSGEIPEKAETIENSYVFCGWEIDGVLYDALPAIEKNTVIRAAYREVRREYKVIFEVAGQEYEKLYGYGEMPAYDGESVFTQDGMKIEIIGWDKAFAEVKGDQRYVAEIQVTDGYLIGFEVDGETLYIPVAINKEPAFYGTPYKKKTEACSYVFKGWQSGENFYPAGDPLPVATEEKVYSAVFEPIYNTFTVSFESQGELVEEREVVYGTVPQEPEILPEKETDERCSYTFSYWEMEGLEYRELPEIYEDSVFTAVFEKRPVEYTLTISYKNGNETLGSFTETLPYGENYSVASPVYEGLTPRVSQCRGMMLGDTEITVAYAEFDVWDGSSEAFAAGEGTQEDPYVITKCAQLYYLAEQSVYDDFSGKYFILNNDLDLNHIAWKAIGSYSLPFAGNFDGNGHSIVNMQYASTLANSNANSGHGLFSTSKGTVKNLSVSGSSQSEAKYTALIVGNNMGEVSGCRSYGSVVGFGNVGGVVGYGVGSVDACINYADISDNGAGGCYRFGGVIGCSGAEGRVENCSNYGTVRVSAGTGSVGGVVGKAEEASVSKCVNYGLVDCTKNAAGGVVGYGSGDFIYADCSNYGPVFGAAYTGGIVGQAAGPGTENSVNEGRVKGDKYVGGICGYASGAVLNAVNRGMVEAAGANSGGIVGYSLYGVWDSENHGEVKSASSSVGGIAGSLQIDTKRAELFASTIENCTNYAKVSSTYTGTNSVIGGIVGRGDRKTVGSAEYQPKISECENRGHVFAHGSYTGGIIGACNGAYVSECINRARVDGSLSSNGSYIGGIAGSNYGYGDVIGCINYGTVVGNSSVDQICGQLTSTSVASGNSGFGKTRVL